MTWWNVVGTHWGWGACLAAIMMLLAFWGFVIAALTVLLGTTRSQARPYVEVPPGYLMARPAAATALGEVTTAAPRRR